MKTRILDARDLRQLVRAVGIDRLMDEIIEGLAEAFRTFDKRKTVVPIRGGFQYGHPQVGLLEWMPAMRVGQRMAIKVVGYHPHNPATHGLPTILSTISMYDPECGHLTSLADATFLTALRTGAASAVASRVMASEQSSTLGLIGCGVQAVTQLHALSRQFNFRTVYLHDTNPNTVRSFPERVSCLALDGLKFKSAEPQSFLEEVDILCTATSVGIGQGPVCADVSVRPHLHINAVGSDFPGKSELPSSLLRRSVVCPDFIDQAKKEGECQQLFAEEVGPAIAEVVRDRPQHAGLQRCLTVFDSTGWALEDLVAMEIVLGHAQRLEIGSTLALESAAEDCLDPYSFLKGQATPLMTQADSVMEIT